MKCEDFDKAIEMAFLEERIDADTFNAMNNTQQYIYSSVRVLRNKLKMEHIQELLELRKKMVNELTQIKTQAGI